MKVLFFSLFFNIYFLFLGGDFNCFGDFISFSFIPFTFICTYIQTGTKL